MFLIGMFVGALFDAIWRWAVELLDIAREEDE